MNFLGDEDYKVDDFIEYNESNTADERLNKLENMMREIDLSNRKMQTRMMELEKKENDFRNTIQNNINMFSTMIKNNIKIIYDYVKKNNGITSNAIISVRKEIIHLLDTRNVSINNMINILQHNIIVLQTNKSINS